VTLWQRQRKEHCEAKESLWLLLSSYIPGTFHFMTDFTHPFHKITRPESWKGFRDKSTLSF
jgi:hypothetical protein